MKCRHMLMNRTSIQQNYVARYSVSYIFVKSLISLEKLFKHYYLG